MFQKGFTCKISVLLVVGVVGQCVRIMVMVGSLLHRLLETATYY